MGVSVIFPAYNEEANITPTISRAIDAMRGLGCDFEVIIVDDASNDATARLADELARQYREIAVLKNPVNLGQGGSIVHGFRKARNEWVIHNGMDYPFDLADLSKLLPLTDRADIVVAVRDRRAGYTAMRIFMSMVNRALIRLLFGLNLRDYNFVQLYRRQVWESIKVEARSTAFLTPEALIRANDSGFRILQVPTNYHARERGRATSGSFKVVSHSLKDMFRFWWRRTVTARAAYRAQCRRAELGDQC